MSADSAVQPFDLSAATKITVYGAQNRPEVAALLPERAFVAESGAKLPADVVLLFVDTAADLAHELAQAAAAVEPGGMLWVCYPTADADGGARDLNRETVVSVFERNGWEPVAEATVGGEWSAVRGQPTGE